MRLRRRRRRQESAPDEQHLERLRKETERRLEVVDERLRVLRARINGKGGSR